MKRADIDTSLGASLTLTPTHVYLWQGPVPSPSPTHRRRESRSAAQAGLRRVGRAGGKGRRRGFLTCQTPVGAGAGGDGALTCRLSRSPAPPPPAEGQEAPPPSTPRLRTLASTRTSPSLSRQRVETRPRRYGCGTRAHAIDPSPAEGPPSPPAPQPIRARSPGARKRPMGERLVGDSRRACAEGSARPPERHVAFPPRSSGKGNGWMRPPSSGNGLFTPSRTDVGRRAWGFNSATFCEQEPIPEGWLACCSNKKG